MVNTCRGDCITMTTPVLRHYGLFVRVIRRGMGFDSALILQRLNPMTLEWYDVSRYGEMSDDYAYTNAYLAGQSLAASIGPSGYGPPMPAASPVE